MALFDRFRRRPGEEDPLIRQPDGLTPSPRGEGFGGVPGNELAHAVRPYGMIGGGMPDLGTMGVMAAEEAAMVQPVGKDQLREASQTLREYMSGKARLDARLIENDKWWRQRHWDVIPERGTTTLKTRSAWLPSRRAVYPAVTASPASLTVSAQNNPPFQG